jgi:hypothetical protein
MPLISTKSNLFILPFSDSAFNARMTAVVVAVLPVPIYEKY